VVRRVTAMAAGPPIRRTEVVALVPAAQGRDRDAECPGHRADGEPGLGFAAVVETGVGHRDTPLAARCVLGTCCGASVVVPGCQPSDRQPCRVWKSPAKPKPPVQVGVSTPLTVTVAPGPAMPMDRPGRTPSTVACAPWPTAMAAGPDRDCEAEVATPPSAATASERLVAAASAEAEPSRP